MLICLGSLRSQGRGLAMKWVRQRRCPSVSVRRGRASVHECLPTPSYPLRAVAGLKPAQVATRGRQRLQDRRNGCFFAVLDGSRGSDRGRWPKFRAARPWCLYGAWQKCDIFATFLLLSLLSVRAFAASVRTFTAIPLVEHPLQHSFGANTPKIAA